MILIGGFLLLFLSTSWGIYIFLDFGSIQLPNLQVIVCFLAMFTSLSLIIDYLGKVTLKEGNEARKKFISFLIIMLMCCVIFLGLLFGVNI